MARLDTTLAAPSPRATRQSARLSSQPPSRASPTPSKTKVARGRPRKHTQSSQPPSSAPSTPPSAKAASGRPRRHVQSRTQLEPVEENSPDSGNADVFQDAVTGPEELRSPGDHSNLSGATAVSAARSVDEVQDLHSNLNALLERLPDLDGDSSRVLRQLALQIPLNVASVSKMAKQLQLQDSVDSKRLQRSESSLADSFESFTGLSHAGRFLRPDLILQAMFGHAEKLDVGRWRPDDILYKANVARMIVAIMTLEQENATTRTTLKLLDDSFSKIFFSTAGRSASSPGSTKLVEEAFEAALAVRTQLALASLRDEVDAMEVVRELFLHPDQELLENSVPRMRSWGIDAFETQTDDHLLQPFEARAYDVYQTLSDAAGSSDSIGRNLTVSWQAFQLGMVSWAAVRTSELDSKINDSGGAETINLMLQERIEDDSMRKQALKRHRASAPVSSNNKLGRALGKIAKSLPGSSRLIRAPVQGQAPASDPVILTVNQPMQKENADATLPRKGRSLIDRQPTAQRLSFDDSQPSQSVIVVDKPGDARAAHNIDAEVTVTQDQGFGGAAGNRTANHGAEQAANTSRLKQVKAGATNAQMNRKRNQEDDSDTRRQVKRVRRAAEQSESHTEWTEERTEDQHDGDLQSPDNESDHEDDERRSGNFVNHPPLSPNYIPPESTHSTTQDAAKRRMASRKSKSGPQKRTPWSGPETDALLDYIDKYGISWAFIKNQDSEGPDILFLRDQVALKDKARNLKMDFLKGGGRISKNLDLVPLKASDKEKLANMGIDADG